MPGFAVKTERDQRVKDRISAAFAEKVTAIEQERENGHKCRVGLDK